MAWHARRRIPAPRSQTASRPPSSPLIPRTSSPGTTTRRVSIAHRVALGGADGTAQQLHMPAAHLRERGGSGGGE
eukprot:3761797-Rhodomonas_salina.2